MWAKRTSLFHGRRWAPCLGVAPLLLVAVLVACGAGSAPVTPSGSAPQATITSPGPSTASASPGASGTATARSVRALPAGADWLHALQVVSYLRAHPPRTPLILMLGSSIVRESVASDSSWSAQVRRLGGPAVAAYDLGSTNQSFAQDARLVPFLPKVPTIVYIGVDVVRFVSDPSNPSISLPAPPARLPSYAPHKYSSARILSTAVKRAKVSDWMNRRYPVFTRNYAYNLEKLRALIKACQDRGLHPVLLDTPRNTAVIRHAWDRPITRYQSSCKTLAAEYGIPFVQMVPRARFVNADFYDVYHAVEPGRGKWQRLLSSETVKLLQQYSMH